MKNPLAEHVHELFTCRCRMAELQEEEARLVKVVLDDMPPGSDTAAIEQPLHVGVMMYTVRVVDDGSPHLGLAGVDIRQVPVVKAELLEDEEVQ